MLLSARIATGLPIYINSRQYLFIPLPPPPVGGSVGVGGGGVGGREGAGGGGGLSVSSLFYVRYKLLELTGLQADQGGTSQC